ncbi:major facilitator superfamily domain-containing protein [Venturia nashicola]|nr:major facilitator superfamily domain-containing protein [Venturia nashicola]
MSGPKENFEINAALASQDQKTHLEGAGTDLENHSPADVEGDEALKILGNGGGVEFDADVNRRLLRKIDLHILPVLCVLYGLQFLDKTTISYASVMGIVKDTHLHGTQYNWLGSVFYLGYLFAEYPANLALQRLPIAKFLSSQIILWGAVLMLHAACSNFAGLAAMRILLGVFESSVSPGFALIVSQWWRKEEQGFRTGIWFCWNGMGSIFGAVTSYAIATSIKSHHYTALKGWQLMYLMTGGLTVLCGIWFFLTIPDSPANARFLTQEEKVMAVERIRSNQQGVGNKVFKKHQMIEALKDPASWMIFVYSVTTSIPNGATTTFKNIILQGFGLSPELSLLYGAPSGAVQIVSTLTICWLADRFKQRLFMAIFALVLPVLGFALLATLHKTNLNGQLVSFYMTSISAAAFTLVLSMISSNVAGQTKKVTVATMMFIGYCIGNLIGPQVVHLKDAPRYLNAKIICCVLYGACSLVLLALRFIWMFRNKQKERVIAELGDAYKHIPNQEFMDLTDGENKEFRYVL